MHKEQNVIKSLLIVVIICLSNNLYCQKKIIGNYSSLKAYQEHYKYYKFNENGIFEYHSGASLGDDEYGKGHYQIKNDSLILNYDLTELKLKSYHKIKEYYNTKLGKGTVEKYIECWNDLVEPILNTNETNKNA